MTSSVYFRGLGARMEHPVIGLYIDGIPVTDKNAYDLEFPALSSLRFIRGPQGTLFGRNTMSGVLEAETLSPEAGETAVGEVSFGTAGRIRLQGVLTRGRHVFSASLRHQEGYFRNVFQGRRCDPYDGIRFYHKYEPRPVRAWSVRQLFSLSLSREGGYAYGLLQDGVRQEASYNDECGYKRLFFSEGLSARRRDERGTLDLSGSLQLLLDRLDMDQDFTPSAVFTLTQRQLAPAVTFEACYRPMDAWEGRWKRVTGLFLYGKHLDMSAPVTFLPDGVKGLILDKANANIPPSIGTLAFAEDRFTVSSDFGIFTWNVSLFHESVLTFGAWQLGLGLRLEYEGGRMNYDSRAAVHYSLPPLLTVPRPYEERYSGVQLRHDPQLLPKLSLQRSFSRKGVRGSLFASAALGHRAGGFNTQLFSDILQNRMKMGLMDEMGVHLVSKGFTPEGRHTVYHPEKVFDLEWGGRLLAVGGWEAELVLYHMECFDQQLTVFPGGNAAGRMMTNAGKGRSSGLEASARYRRGAWEFRGSYGGNRAVFVCYKDGGNDYAGKCMPYAPEHTLSLSGAYTWSFAGRLVESCTLSFWGMGAGRIWWDEANSLCQPFYATLSARISARLPWGALYLEGENLTGTRYNAFYFKSLDRSFAAPGLPLRALIGIQINLI